MTKINHPHIAKKLSLGAIILLFTTTASTQAQTAQPVLSVAFNYSLAPGSDFPAGFTIISGTIGTYAPMPEAITGTDSKTYTVGVTSGTGGGIVVRDPKFSGTPVNKGDFTYASLYSNMAYSTGTSMVLSIAGVTPHTTYTITLFAWDLIAHSNHYTTTFAAVAPTSGAGGTVTEFPNVPPTSNLQYSTTFDVTSTTSQLNISITGNVAPAFFNGFTLAVRGDKPTPKAAVADNSVILPPPTPPPGTPVAVFAVPRLGQLTKFFDYVRQARSGPVDLIFDGDSITEWWQEVAYNLWQQRYAPLNAIDFGESTDVSDQTQNLLWRLNHGELDGLHPKLIVVMIGSHNIGSDTPEEIAAGIKAIVDTYRKDCPDSHILLLGLFPRANLPTDAIRLTIKQINGIISKYDDGKHVTYLDIGDKFLQPDGTLSADIMPDFLHPSPKGYAIWADAIQPVVDQYVPKTAVSPPGAPSPAITSNEPALSWPFPLNPPAGVSPAIFPVPPDDWIDRFAGNLDKLKQGPYDLVFDGDSITDFWQAAGANVLKERFGSRKVLDLGLGGDQVQHALWRLRNSDFTGWNPKLIMLLIGSNNVGQNPQDVAAGVKLMVDEYETRCPSSHLLLMGLFPRDAQPNTPNRNWIKAVNAIISTYGSDPRVTYMDIGDKFLQPDGTLSTDIMPDFLHPSPKGYAIWADAIQPVIDKYCPASGTAAPK